jgi:hypothetical protein
MGKKYENATYQENGRTPCMCGRSWDPSRRTTDGEKSGWVGIRCAQSERTRVSSRGGE